LPRTSKAARVGEEIHPGEAIEEKISLSERFGLWISFLSLRPGGLSQHRCALAEAFGCHQDEIVSAERDALNWALERGSRSGRVAWQFARDWAGRQRVAPSRAKRRRTAALPVAAPPSARKRPGDGA
jgi:predicted AAA+ superfamily ATPase